MKRFYQNTLKPMVLMLLLVVLAGLMAITVDAQENSNLMAEIGYMKVESGNGGDYEKMEREVWKPIHEERIKKGLLDGWILYKVWYTGTDDSYNYVTINLYRNPMTMEEPYKGINFKEIHPDKDISKMMAKTMKLRDMVRVQLINRENYVYPDGGDAPAPFKYIVKNTAKLYNKSVTYMPKPIQGDNGSGMHVHISLWKKGKPLFAGSGYAGLSEMALYFIKPDEK